MFGRLVLGVKLTATMSVSLVGLLLNGAGAQQPGQSRLLPNPVTAGHQRVTVADPTRGQGSGHFNAPRSGNRRHNGVDLAADVGTPVQVVQDGTVVRSESSGPYSTVTQGPQDPTVDTARRERRQLSAGNNVVVSHSDGSTSYYYHLDGRNQPSEGDRVVEGQMIGRVGRSGNVPENADPHLHFEYRDRVGNPVRPEIEGISSNEVTIPVNTTTPTSPDPRSDSSLVTPREPGQASATASVRFPR